MTKAIRTGVLLLALALAPAQDLDKARALLLQALTALQPAPVVVAIATPAGLQAAIATAAPGAVLTLSRTLVYPTALSLTTAVTLQAEGLTALTRMDATTPLPLFQDGITIPGDDVTLIGLDVRKRDPLTDLVVVTGARVTLDRLRILGGPLQGGKRGIRANGNGACQVLRSYVDDCFQSFPGNDSQAICAWDMAPGLLIADNFLRGGSETVMIGGADAATPDRMPRDVTIRGNTITKTPAWQARPIGVKNTLELKAATHVLIADNDISQSWGGHGQDGYLLLMTVRNQDGRAPWSTVQDVTVTGNRFSSGAGAINLLGLDNIKESKPNMPTAIGVVRPSVRMARIAITGNTFTDLDPTRYTGSTRMILIGAGPEQVTIDQNTFAGAHLGSQVYFYGAPVALGFTLTNNTWPTSTYGIKGDGTASGTATWAAYVSGGTLSGNVVQP